MLLVCWLVVLLTILHHTHPVHYTNKKQKSQEVNYRQSYG